MSFLPKLSSICNVATKDKKASDKMQDASVQLAVWRNGGSNPAENAVRN
jgi:hypothetical protein